MGKTTRSSSVALVIMLSLVLYADFPYPAAGQGNYDVVKRGVVKIIAYQPENVRDIGAGIVVGVDKNIALIATAHHVVKDAKKIEVVFFDMQWERFSGRLFERYHEDLDMSVIVVDPPQGRSVPADLPGFILGDMSKLKAGERVSTIGHPLDLNWEVSVNTNTLARLSDRGDFRKFRFTKTAIEHGSAGGPVFNEQGALIGTVTKVDPIHAVAVKIDAVVSVLIQEWRIPTNLLRP